MNRNEVVLVDEKGRRVGVEDKLRAHQNGGRLHLAISVFIFARGRMLLQQRARDKYHFAGLWSNACCSHPQDDETVAEAAHARLREELGFDAELKEVGTLIYRDADPASELTEHEFDHLFCGEYAGPIRPNLDEIRAVEWVRIGELTEDVAANPGRYTPWLRRALDQVLTNARKLGYVT